MGQFYSLFSSSKGNASYIGTKKNGILIDAGVSCKRLTDKMRELKLSTEGLQGILITHTHSDHISGLKVFLKKHAIPVYGTEQTLQYLEKNLETPADLREISCGENFSVGEMQVQAFETSHDCDGSCGYRVTCADGQSCGVCTDLGVVTDQVLDTLKQTDLVLCEANYDPEMLRKGPYPYSLQQRIAGQYGHLSNRDGGGLARELITRGTTRIILGHLSENNNTMHCAEQTVLSVLQEANMQRNRDFMLQVSSPQGLQQGVMF